MRWLLPWRPLPWNSQTYSQSGNRRCSEPNTESPKARQEREGMRRRQAPEGDRQDGGMEEDKGGCGPRSAVCPGKGCRLCPQQGSGSWGCRGHRAGLTSPYILPLHHQPHDLGRDTPTGWASGSGCLYKGRRQTGCSQGLSAVGHSHTAVKGHVGSAGHWLVGSGPSPGEGPGEIKVSQQVPVLAR